MRRLVALIALILIAAQPAPARAQSPVTSTAITPGDVARLSDEEVRRLLLERLVVEDGGGAAQAPFNPAFTAYALQQELGRAQLRAGEIAASFPDMLRLPGEAWARMMRDRSAGAFGLFLAVFALSVAAAIAADRWLARRLSQYLPEPPPLEQPPVGSRASAACAGLMI